MARCEPRSASLESLEITSTAEMDALIDQLKFDAKRPPEKRKYRTLVVDTVDHYQKLVINEFYAYANFVGIRPNDEFYGMAR